MISEAAVAPRPSRALRGVADRRTSRREHRFSKAASASASAQFWMDPTSNNTGADKGASKGADNGDGSGVGRDAHAELAQEVLALRRRIGDQVEEIAARHPNPSFSEEAQQHGVDQKVHAANAALRAFPHLKALQKCVRDMDAAARLFPSENVPEQQRVVDVAAKPSLCMDDFWEDVAAATPAQRLTILSDLLVPQTMAEFVVATETFFHIRGLLEDEDELYVKCAEANPLAVQLLLALEDAQPHHVPQIAKLLCLLSQHRPLKQLMLKRHAVPLIQARKRAIRDEATIAHLQALLQALVG